MDEAARVAGGAAAGAAVGLSASAALPALAINRYVRVGEGKFPEPYSRRISIGNTPGKKFEVGISRNGRIDIKFGSQRFNIKKGSNGGSDGGMCE